MNPGPGATVCDSTRTAGGVCVTYTSLTGTVATVGPVVVTSRVTVVFVVTGCSSAQPNNVNGASASIQMRILIILPSV